MIDQFSRDRYVISPIVVAPGVSVGTKGMAVVEENNSEVPREAWRAANAAFESPEWSQDRDELAQALLAAAPHIRTDELDTLIRMLHVRATQIPLLGRRNNALREALDEVIRLLTERKSALEEGSP